MNDDLVRTATAPPNDLIAIVGSAITVLAGGLAAALRLSGRIAEAEAKVKAFDARLEKLEARIEKLDGKLSDTAKELKAEIAAAPPPTRGSRSGIQEEIVETVVRGQLRDLDARIDGMADRLGEVVGAVKVLTGQRKP